MENDPSQMTAADQPSEEELRAQIEEQLRSVRVQDLLVDSAASIVNLTARRIAKPDEQDLDQARIGIEAVRALADLIDGEVEGQIRGALSELQIIYARAAKGEPLDGSAEEAQDTPPAAAPTPDAPSPPKAPPAQDPGPANAPPRLWTPGRD